MNKIVRQLKVVAIMFAIAVLLSGCVYMQFRIIYDCGWFALLRGSEWIWLFGGCHK